MCGLLFAGTPHAHAVEKAWTLDANGVVTSVSAFPSYGGGYYFVGNSLNPNSGSFPTCGAAGTGLMTSTSTIGQSVFTAGGLGTDPAGAIDCRTPGYYYLVYTDGTPFNTVQYHYTLYYNGTTAVVATTSANYQQSTLTQNYRQGINTSYATRFTNATISGTNLNISYFLSSAEIVPNVPTLNPTQVKITYSKIPDGDFTKESYNMQSTTTNVVATTTINLQDTNINADGDYDLLIQFGNPIATLNGETPFEEAYIYATLRRTNNNTWSIVGQLQVYTNLTPPSATSTNPCGLTNLSGCISNAGAFLFVPSTDSLNNFITLKDSLAVKFPFAYLYDVSTAITTAISTNSNKNVSVTIPFGSIATIPVIDQAKVASIPQATLLKTLITAFLWLGFSVAVYRRTYRIFNPQIS